MNAMLDPVIAATSTQRLAACAHGASAAAPWRIAAPSQGSLSATLTGHTKNASAIFAAGVRHAAGRGIDIATPTPQGMRAGTRQPSAIDGQNRSRIR